MNQLDTEALALFHASSAQRAKWEDFTPGQKNCWRSVAQKAREIHANKHTGFPKEDEIPPHVRIYAEDQYQRFQSALEEVQRGIMTPAEFEDKL